MTDNKIVWVDVIRVFAIVLVVLQHVVTPLIYSFNIIQISDWWLANIYHSISDICVPLLLMVSGYLLINTDKPIKYFIKKRIFKVLIPLIAWTFIYLLWNHYYNHNIELSFINLLKTIIQPAQYHLWFLYTIIALYLLIPILNTFMKNASISMQYYFIILWFASISISPLIQKILNTNPYKEDLSILSGYLGYLLIGHILGNTKIDRKYLPILMISSILLITFSSVATYYLTLMDDGIVNKYFHMYLSPNVIILSSIIFVILKIIFEDAQNMNGYYYLILNKLSAATFGIYLVHVIVLNFLKHGDFGFTLTSFTLTPSIGIPALTALIFLISFIIIYFMQKTIFIRKCVP